MASDVGFNDLASEEIVLAVSELGTNLVRHAKGGILRLARVAEGDRAGIQVESQDAGPGIADTERAIGDGFSTKESLGYGLGTVNRLMDEFEIESSVGSRPGTYIVCRRWVRAVVPSTKPCPLDIGAATRPRPGMSANGDAFVIRTWSEGALAGVIDGVGHGPLAHRAAQAARQYAENHSDRPLLSLLQGVERACRSTRGVVMALARFDFGSKGEHAGIRLSFASIGNVSERMFGGSGRGSFIVRRGILGASAPNPVVTEHPWEQDNILILHSDGVAMHWGWEDVPVLRSEPADVSARSMLRALAKGDDDATVVVVKEAVL